MAVIGGALRKIHFLAFDLPHKLGLAGAGLQ